MRVLFFKNGKITSLLLPNFLSFLLLRFSEKIARLLLYPRIRIGSTEERLTFLITIVKNTWHFCYRAPRGFPFSEEQRFCEVNNLFAYFIKIH